MTRLDLTRVLTIILESELKQWRRRVVAEDVAELGDWIARHDRLPTFTWNGPKAENALALRLHSYRCRLAGADGLPSPADPMIAATSDVSTPRHLRQSASSVVDRRRRMDEARRRLAEEDVSQDCWPDEAA